MLINQKMKWRTSQKIKKFYLELEKKLKKLSIFKSHNKAMIEVAYLYVDVIWEIRFFTRNLLEQFIERI